MEIYKTPIGILVMKDGKIADKAIFKKDPKVIAEKLLNECDEEKAIAKKHPKLGKGKERLPLADLAEQVGFCTKDEFPALVSLILQEKAKLGVSKGFGRDKLVVNAVRAQRALENNVNTEAETLREWYSIHFPEMNDLLKENKDYAEVVVKLGLRKNMTEEALSKILSDKRYAKAIPPIAKESMGSDMTPEDLKIIQDYAKTILESDKEEGLLKEYIEKTMESIAPNVSAVATPYVGGLLIEQAGTLEKLATVPSSTVQVLGAQKAMFRFLKTHTKPPKYGVLFVHPLVSQASKKS